MPVPSQVEEQAELAEQLHAQMFSTEETETQDETETEVIDPIEEDEVDVPHDDDVEELRKFKARYMSLKGKYDAEVPRLSQELRDLKTSVFEKFEQATKPAVVVETPTNVSDEFLDSFAENYGEDFADNLKKLIALEAAKLTTPMQQKMESVEDTQVKAAQTNFVGYIDEQLNEGRETPVDWQGLWAGKDPKFLEFLGKPDPSGLYTYGQLAEMYNQNWDADKLVNIFKIYTNEEVVPVVKPKTVSPQKQALVAPSRNNTHTAPNTESKKVWTSDMVQEFQRLDRQGKYGVDESKALWDDLLSALGENRIR